MSKNLQLFCFLISKPKINQDNKEINEKKKDEININSEVKDIKNTNKNIVSFLFITFKLIKKVRNIFLF